MCYNAYEEKRNLIMKRFFRLFLATLSIAACLFSLAGCSQGATTSLDGAYFLSNSANVGIISNVNEVNTYDVTFTPSKANESQIIISLVGKEGFNTYVTTLTNTEYEGTACYLLETTLKTNISYTLGGEDLGTFEDYSVSKVYFLSVSDKLKPLYSETTASAHSPVRNNDGKYEVSELKYSYSTVYGDSEAVVDFKPEKGEFGIKEGKRTYEKYNKSTYYFDNATMLFIPRAISLTDSSSLSFSAIDALSGVNRSMTMTSDSSKPSENVIYSETSEESGVINATYYVNAYKNFRDEETGNQVIPCKVVNFAVSGTFSGSNIKCWYADTALLKAGARLIKMETSAPYGLGTFTYVIKNTVVAY